MPALLHQPPSVVANAVPELALPDLFALRARNHRVPRPAPQNPGHKRGAPATIAMTEYRLPQLRENLLRDVRIGVDLLHVVQVLEQLQHAHHLLGVLQLQSYGVFRTHGDTGLLG